MARVVPDVTGLDKQFDYLVPDELRDQVGVGTMVRVALAGRRIGGWVVSIGAPDPDVPISRLRPLAKVTGHGPAPELVDLAAWASHRWAAGRLRPFLNAASPPRAVPVVPAPAHSASAPGGAVDPGAVRLLGEGGGVLRRPPNADPVPVILAAAPVGPVLVVTPAVDEARLLGARLRRAGLTVAVVPREWAAAAGGVDVVIGARAAAWAPMPVLGSVVVLDEHDEALQEERAPTWHARDVARERARRAGAPFLLVSPVPSLDVLASGDRLDVPSRNEERAGWPILEIVDRTQDEPWRRSHLSSALIRSLRDPDRVVVCVLNAPGRARRLACRACRALQRCERCQAAVSQTREGVLRCARCGTERPVVCQSCGASALVVLRPGVSRLREELEAAAGRPVAEVTGADRDSGAGSAPADVAVFVGTEAVLHRVRRADVVAFLDFDDELLAPRFRADEQALSLLVRAARLVGPRAGGGRILVQTRLPHHEVLDAVLHADPGRLTAPALARRAELDLPPARALALLSGPGAEELAIALGDRADLAVAGPADGRYLVRGADPEALADGLAAAPRPSARVRIEVDPPRV